MLDILKIIENFWEIYVYIPRAAPVTRTFFPLNEIVKDMIK